MIAWMKDEMQKTNDPEEIKLWDIGIAMGNDLMQLLKDIINMQRLPIINKTHSMEDNRVHTFLDI